LAAHPWGKSSAGITIQDELLDPHGPFDSLDAAQAAVDAWRTEYNTLRPHQSLDMATPPRGSPPSRPNSAPCSDCGVHHPN
jgi:transposase InsO family protein